MGAVEMSPYPGKPGHRAYDAMCKAFSDFDIMIRITADTIALSPPLIVSKAQIDEIVDKVRGVIEAVA